MFISAIKEISEAVFSKVLSILFNFAALVAFFDTGKYDKVLMHSAVF